MLNEIVLSFFDENGFDKKFIVQNIHICFRFRMLLGDYSLYKFKKLSIKLTSGTLKVSNGVAINLGQIQDLDPVVQIWQPFDIVFYNKVSLSEKRKIIWNEICHSLELVAGHYNQDIKPIIRAKEIGLKSNFDFGYETKYNALNKKLKLTGVLFVTADELSFIYWVCVYDANDKLVARKQIAEFSPTDGYEVAYYIKCVKWNKYMFQVFLKGGKVLEVNIQEDQF